MNNLITYEELKDNRKKLNFNTFGHPVAGYYGIYYGIDPDSGKIVAGWVAYSWKECLYYTNKVKGAKFKKFQTYEKARDFAMGKTMKKQA